MLVAIWESSRQKVLGMGWEREMVQKLGTDIGFMWIVSDQAVSSLHPIFYRSEWIISSVVIEKEPIRF